MRLDARRLFPLFLLVLVGTGLVWALTFASFEPAEFTFINGTEIQSVDPAKVTGVPEGRIINAIFEGLLRPLPSAEDASVLEPQPALAESYTVSDDQLTYTFAIRAGAPWVRLLENGEAERLRDVTAQDFYWSWKRFLTPETASQYAYQLFYVKNARKYSSGMGELEIGDRVEIEESNRKYSTWQYPSGDIHQGVLVEQVPAAPPEPSKIDNDGEPLTEEEIASKAEELRQQWLRSCQWVVELKPEVDGQIDWEAEGVVQRFRLGDANAEFEEDDVTPCRSVLLSFSEVGIRAPDDRTFIVELESPTPFFKYLCAFYPMYPMMRENLEEFGEPGWTKPGQIATCGPFQLEFRRIRDRIRLRRNADYWNAENVALETVDALVSGNETTGLNMYLDGQADWTTTVPADILPAMKEREAEDPNGELGELQIAPLLGVYFYRFNTTKGALVDVRVRRALNMAVDKQQICEYITRGGQVPATGLVPTLGGYEGPQGDAQNIAEAKRLLDEARADGVEIGTLQILYNTGSGHETIADTISQQWKRDLGVDVETRVLEWGTYLSEVRLMKYEIARAGWIGDYPDPNTFLDMFVTGGENNQTGWSNARYDECIRLAATENDPDAREALLAEAESILIAEMPILPIYYYVSVNVVRTYVDGFHPNAQDIHDLSIISIDEEEKQKVFEREGLR